MTETQTTIVYKKIKKKIENGEYSPAQSLPELTLAKEYNVSRNTIKKALLMLENDGYVTMDLNKGAKVTSYSKEEVLQFLELRELLEGFIIRQAVPNFQKKDTDKLRTIIGQMKKYAREGALMDYSACNHEFHKLIYANCSNKPAVDMTIKLKNQMKKYNSKTILIPGRINTSLKEHTAIYEAIRDKDENRAEMVIKEHIHNVRSIFEQYYSFLF